MELLNKGYFGASHFAFVERLSSSWRLQRFHYVATKLCCLQGRTMFSVPAGANSRDYHSGLGCYNQMVSSGNFSEISGFMPGIKTLLNLGIQLRV